MARFYLHLHNHLDVRDQEGVEFPDADAAIAEALHSAREIASWDVKAGSLNLRHRIDVEDEQHQHVATVSFADAVSVEA